MNSEVPLDLGFCVRDCMTRTGERTPTGVTKRVLEPHFRVRSRENGSRLTRRKRIWNGARNHSFAPSSRATGGHGRSNRRVPSGWATSGHGRSNRSDTDGGPQLLPRQTVGGASRRLGQPGQRECTGRGPRGHRFAWGNQHLPKNGAVGNRGDRVRRRQRRLRVTASDRAGKRASPAMPSGTTGDVIDRDEG